MSRTCTAATILVLMSILTIGQATAPPPRFDIVDVHTSARMTSPSTRGGVFRGGRYVLRQANMVNLIAAAYGVDEEKILGGPSWLENDRFDVIANAPPATPTETVKLMLQTMLSDRFKLVVHTDTKPQPAYTLSLGKGQPKLKKAEGSSTSGCAYHAGGLQPGEVAYQTVSCRDMSLEAFTQTVRTWTADYLATRVVDSTGLQGVWDFDLKWNPRAALAEAGVDGISIFDAISKQLGLTLSLQNVPTPVIVVDSVNETPTANPPEIATALVPPAPVAFEVAVIKPVAPDAPGGGSITNREIDLHAITLKYLIFNAWNIRTGNNEGIVGAPKWLSTDRFYVVAKASTEAPSSNTPQIDIDDFRQMLRTLLIDHFKMVVHTEERPVTAYTLVAANPKLQKADALNRTGCKEGPGPDGKDPRLANPVLNRLITCRNMSMAQFAEQLPTLMPDYIYYPVLNATEIEGAWDFTLSFSSANQLQVHSDQGAGSGGDASAAAAGATGAPDPNGALSLFEAISKQLGLKLEMHKRPNPVLVIDHIEEKPTGN